MLRTYWYDTVDPFRELTSLQQWMDQTLQQTLNSFAQTPQVVSNSAFVPKAEVFETDDQIALKLEVPGLSEKDFEITLNNHVLTVRGERKLENGFKQENLAWTERPYGTFSRSFNLPTTVDANTINATYTNGVLQIVLAKHESAKPKQIPVKSSQKELTASASA
jgi:HSP20 family protein